jgi:hypothetical protein
LDFSFNDFNRFKRLREFDLQFRVRRFQLASEQFALCLSSSKTRAVNGGKDTTTSFATDRSVWPHRYSFQTG